MEPQQETWLAPDGERLPSLYWPAMGEPRGLIVAMHGLGGCANDFDPLAAHLAPKGWSLAAPEMRGQGRDPQRKRIGDVHDATIWPEDLRHFVRLTRERHPHLPTYVYGESLGGAVALHMTASLSAAQLPQGLILASPVLDITQPLAKWQVALFRSVAALAPRFRVDVDKFARRQPGDKRVTRDESHMERIRHAPHRFNRMTLRFLVSMHRLVADSREVAPRVTVPVLMIYAGHDIFIPTTLAEGVYDRLTAAPRREKVLFPDAFHLLLHDHDKAEVLAVVDHWLAREMECRQAPLDVAH